VRAVFRGHTEDAPADTLARFQQRDAQTQPLQQTCGHQARQAGADDHDLRWGAQSLGCRRRRIRLVCIHRAEWRRRDVGRGFKSAKYWELTGSRPDLASVCRCQGPNGPSGSFATEQTPERTDSYIGR